jgi:hypothetical protein
MAWHCMEGCCGMWRRVQLANHIQLNPLEWPTRTRGRLWNWEIQVERPYCAAPLLANLAERPPHYFYWPSMPSYLVLPPF